MNNMHGRGTFLLLIVFMLQPLAAQAEKDPEETNSFVGMENRWPEILEPENFEIGLFPNNSGGTDFIAIGNFIWLSRFSSAILASYSTYSTNYNVDTIEGTTNQQDIEVSVDLFKILFPFIDGENFIFSLEPGVNLRYLNYDLETYGYRNNTDDSITFFNQNNITHNISGSLFCEFSSDYREILQLDLMGAFYPLIYIYEDGDKYYSTLETPISNVVENAAQGFQVSGGLSVNLDNIFERSMGIINVGVNYFQQFGNHTTENNIALYNWQTTIVETEWLVRGITEVEVSYEITPLGAKMKVTPAIGFKYIFEEENYGGVVTDQSRIKIGFSTKL